MENNTIEILKQMKNYKQPKPTPKKVDNRVKITKMFFKKTTYQITTLDNKFLDILTPKQLGTKLKNKELILDSMLEGYLSWK